MRLMIAAVAIAVGHGTASAADEPYGWDHCMASSAELGVQGCVAYVAAGCGDTASRCVMDQAQDWRAYDVNLRLAASTDASDLKAMADAIFQIRDLLKDAAARCGEDAECHLDHAVGNAIEWHAGAD